MIDFKKKNRGFTMIEAFVAITVLLIAVLGPLTLLTRAINDANYAKYQVVASFLLQEGLDLAVAKGAELGNGYFDIKDLGAGCDSVSPCRIYSEPVSYVSIKIDKTPADFSLYTDADGIYSHVSGTKTIFSRRIWFENITDDNGRMVGYYITNELPIPQDEIIGRKVFVQINWTYKGISKTQLASTIVYE